MSNILSIPGFDKKQPRSGFSFGNISTSLRPEKAGQETKPVPFLIEDKVQDEGPFYIFLMDGAPDEVRLKLLQTRIREANIFSYLIVNAINKEFDKADKKTYKDGLGETFTNYRSDWTKFIDYKGKHCSGIMAFGAALYGIIKSTDVMVDAFYAANFIRPYFYLGHGFCGDYDTFIVPVDYLKDIFPVMFDSKGNLQNFCWKTKFFTNQLKVLKDPNKWLPDMRPLVHHVMKTREEFDEVLKANMGAEAVAYDTETTGLDTTRDKVICLTITWNGQDGYFAPWDIINKRLLVQNIESCKHRITQNGKFDCKMMWNNGLPFGSVEPTDDTGQLAHAIHSDRRHGLKPLAIFHTYFGGYDYELDKFKKQTGIERYDKIPADILSKYAINDALSTWRCYYVMMDIMRDIDKKYPNEKMSDWNIEKWYKDIMMPVYPDFIEMEARGFYVDLDEQKKGQDFIKNEIEELKEAMGKAWGVDPKTFPFSSNPALGKLFKSKGWPEVEVAKNGVYATSDSVLTEYERLGLPGVTELKKYRTDNVFLHTFLGERDGDNLGWNAYIREEEDGQHMIHCNFSVNGTTSYRNKGNEPNLQQIPVHHKNAKYVMKMITVPQMEEYTIEDDKGNVYKGIGRELLKLKDGTLKRFDQITETDEIDSYYGDPVKM